MENIMERLDSDAIEDEALVWLIRLDGDKPLSAAEERAFDQWLARSPAHRYQLKTLNTFWANSNILSELVEPESIMALSRKRIAHWFWPLSGFRVAAVASIFMLSPAELSKRIKFSNKSINRVLSQVPRSIVSRLTIPSSSSSIRFHSVKNLYGLVIVPTLASVPLLKMIKALE